MTAVDSDYSEQNMSESSYFQSSFARSMAFQNATQYKSADSDYIPADYENLCCDYMPGCNPVFANVSKSASVSSVKSYAKPKPSASSRRNSAQVDDDRPDGRRTCVHKTENKESSMEDEILRLRAECQNLAEENKRLQRLSLQSTNASLLQSQLDSLQWQLRQTESSKQMYRAVMEQVSKFLERVHKNLDIISSKMSTSPKTKTSRFPRSRSVHTMAGTCASSNGNISSSRCSSPSPTHYSTISNSTQITNCSVVDPLHELDLPQNSFAEYTWKPTRPPPEHVTLEKLSQESFRFYRTVQSLLNTREPDLIHRLTPSVSEVTLPDEKTDNTSVGSCASLYQGSCAGNRKSLDTSSSCSAQFPSMVDDLETGGPVKIPETSSPKPICIDDESGFSSMSSFHDVNVTYPKLGLPIVECGESKHRRWNSTPVDKMYESSNVSLNFCNNEMLQVLWV